MMNHLPRAGLLSILWFALQTAVPAAGLQDKAKTDTELQYEVTVILKLVQVHVSDKKGRPVTDLKKTDFVLYDNGEEREITDFEVHMPPTEQSKTAAVESETPPGRPIPIKMNRKFFLLFDLSRMRLSGFKPSKRAALHFLDTGLNPEDEVGLITFSEVGGIRIREFLTGDHRKVRQIVSDLKEILGKGNIGSSPFDRMTTEAAPSIPTGGEESLAVQMLAPPRDAEAGAALHRNLDFLTIMRELAKSTRYIAGQKHFIYFSDGFAQGLYEGDPVFQSDFDAMVREFAAANSSVHTINSEGRRRLARPREGRGDYVLQKLALDSGGSYFADVERTEEIAEGIRQVSGYYYVLGYSVGQARDGRYHDIKVEVRRPGLRVTAQRGYFNPKEFPKYTSLEKQFHLLDLAMNPKPVFQEPLHFPLAAFPLMDRERDNLLLIAALAGDGLAGVLGKKTEIVTLVFDTENQLVDQSRREADMSGLPGGRFLHGTPATVPPGTYAGRIVLRNLMTGKGAVGFISIELPAAETNIFVTPPLILARGSGTEYLRITDGKAALDHRAPAALRRYYSGRDTAGAPLIGALPVGTGRIAVVLHCRIRDIPRPDIQFRFDLYTEDGDGSVPLGYTLLESWKAGEGTDGYLFELELPDSGPGGVRLEVTATEIATQARSRSKIRFHIR